MDASGADVLDDGSVSQGDDAVATLGNLLLVRDEDDRLTSGVEVVEDAQDHLSGGCVQVPGGFVGEDDQGIVDEGPGDGGPLLLASGKLRRAVMSPVGEADDFDHGLGSFAAVGGRMALIEEGDFEILEHGELRNEVEALKDETDALASNDGTLVVTEAGDVVAAEKVASRGGSVEAADQVHEGALTGPTLPSDGYGLALFKIEIDTAECMDQYVSAGCSVGLRKLLDGRDDHGVGRFRVPFVGLWGRWPCCPWLGRVALAPSFLERFDASRP